MATVLPPERQPDETEVDWIDRLIRYYPSHPRPEGWERVVVDRDLAALKSSPWGPKWMRDRL